MMMTFCGSIMVCLYFGELEKIWKTMMKEEEEEEGARSTVRSP